MANRRKFTAKRKRERETKEGTARPGRLLTERAKGRKTKGQGGKSAKSGKSGKEVQAPRVATASRNRRARRPERMSAPGPAVRSVPARAPLRAPREAQAVALLCLGILTLVSLATYDAADASLNASGSSQAHNWIGPAGAYWADLIFQVLGIGSFAVAVGLALAGCRAFVGKRILPSFREAAGMVLLMVCSGSLAHILLRSRPTPYPAGGIVGAILGELFLEQFALFGACVLTGALVLAAFALTVDGVLMGLGLKGLGALRVLARGLHTSWVTLRARRERLAERRAERLAIPAAYNPYWTFGDGRELQVIDEGDAAGPPVPAPMVSYDVTGDFGDGTGPDPDPDPSSEQASEIDEIRREERIAAAIERGRQLADDAANREAEEARLRALRDGSEPDIALDETIDIPAESRMAAGEFATGEFPVLDTTPGRSPIRPTGAGETARSESLLPEGVAGSRVDAAPDATEPTPVQIRAALPEPVSVESSPIEDELPLVPEAPKVQSVPKSLLKSRSRSAPEPEIVDVRPEVNIAAIEEAANEAQIADTPRTFELPSPALLDIEATNRAPIDRELLHENAQKLTKTLKHYGIEGVVREIRPGPVITMYEFVPAPGTKISKIASLADDLAMSMRALRVRIVAPIPGKGAVGIEIPNESVEMVFLKELVAHQAYRKSRARLPIALGKDIEGGPCVTDLTKMPHLLVAGATGAGKSVSINAMIMSLLYGKTPEEVRLILVDPKMLELSVYEGVPHLLLPVVTDPKKAAVALRWAVSEMEKRYKYLSTLGVRNIDGFNKKIEEAGKKGEPLTVEVKDALGNTEQKVCEHMPYIVIIVDELADLMMVASREVESSIMRLAQMARAAGIHLILATQRPSVDVLTGVIKANFPTRIAFQVASKHDSRTILDGVGAEHLLGRGDMLFVEPGAGGVSRVHGAYVSEPEIERTVAFIKAQGEPEYDESILAADGNIAETPVEDSEIDELYQQAVAIVTETRQASISMIQRRLRIGYNRAARLVEQMEKDGIVGQADGPKPREILLPPV